MGINDILRCKNGSELEVLSNSENLSKVQDKYNDCFLDTAIQRSKGLCFRNKFTLIECQKVTPNDLWVDGIHLTILGEARLAKVFVIEVNDKPS